MDLTTICVATLVAVVAVSCVTSANVGLLALALAWAIGGAVAPLFGQSFPGKTVAGWFPVDLFITLTGVCLLFTIARQNGTLALVTNAGVRACRSQPRLLPVLYFALAAGLSASGAGNVPTAALVAPPAMTAAARLGIPALVMMVMVGHGSIAGTLSPLAPMGVIADEKLAAMGLPDRESQTFWTNLLVNAAVAAVGYVLLRGWRVARGVGVGGAPQAAAVRTERRHLLTLGLLGALVAGTLWAGVHVGLAALAAATLLVLVGAGSERDAFRELPWGVVFMVCGMSVLVTLCEKTGALDLFSRGIASCATTTTLTAWLAGLTGLISVFSSTSGVVLPTFLPTVPGVIELLGAEPTPDRVFAAATAVNVGSNIVDVSSVSTIGALCVAACPDEPTRRLLYRQGFAWGMAMTVVGALVCWAVLGRT